MNLSNSIPKASVIIPCYNVEKYLDRCINSIVNQTLRDIEIILVDDGSPDRVPEMCEQWENKDSRIKVVHKKNGGLGYACNSGIEVAEGEYIAFCDSDDWVDTDCYETMYKAAKGNNADAVYCDYKNIDEQGNITLPLTCSEAKIYENTGLIDFQFGMISTEPAIWVERYRQMSAKVVLYSNSIIQKNHIRFHSEREHISEDLLFNLDFLRCSTKVVALPNAFYYYFVNTQSLTHTYRADRFLKYKELREYLLGHYDYAENNDEYKQRVNKMFIGYVRNTLNKIVLSDKSKLKKYRLIRSICNDNIWQEIATEYPVKQLPMLKKLVFTMLRNKSALTLYAFIAIKNLR